ncbi:hypothetical protein A4G28_00885 [Mycobacterium ostraviense]|uniref:Uncharacterized protein n=1 Tax=Mycobacterium ostraviense TaxID=2738409 RepID=A0A163YD59_9MYCO|nr:hypothetical protein A4G28_00885 [Mycobacterium ostraviense]
MCIDPATAGNGGDGRQPKRHGRHPLVRTAESGRYCWARARRAVANGGGHQLPRWLTIINRTSPSQTGRRSSRIVRQVG